MPTSQAPPRAAPPPFSRQSTRSRVVLACLVVTVAGVVAAGTLITLPTHVSAAATLADPAGCAALAAPAGAAGCAVVRLDPGWSARLAPAVPARLLTADEGATVPVELVRTPAAGGPVLAAALDEPPPPGPVTAVADIGRRPLGLVFLGQGLEARP